MDIHAFKNKRVWAVVGSVHNHEKFAYKIYNYLKSKGYKVYAVDPAFMVVDGERSYASLCILPEIPEAVDMVINPVQGEKYLEEANTLGIKHIWFQPGADNQYLVNKAESYGMNVVNKHCVMTDLI